MSRLTLLSWLENLEQCLGITHLQNLASKLIDCCIYEWVIKDKQGVSGPKFEILALILMGNPKLRKAK